MGLFLAVESGGYSPAGVRMLLLAVTPCAEHRLEGTWAAAVAAPGLQSTGSTVVQHGLGCSVTCGIFLDQTRIEPMLPALAGRFFTTESPGKPLDKVFLMFIWKQKGPTNKTFCLPVTKDNVGIWCKNKECSMKREKFSFPWSLVN